MRKITIKFLMLSFIFQMSASAFDVHQVHQFNSFHQSNEVVVSVQDNSVDSEQMTLTQNVQQDCSHCCHCHGGHIQGFIASIPSTNLFGNKQPSSFYVISQRLPDIPFDLYRPPIA